MHAYDDLINVRDEKVCGLGPWTWIRDDSGAWEGPHNELPQLRDALYQYVKKKDVCIQAGGNQGLFPRVFAEDFKAVYTFEPEPLNFYVLSRNCQRDNIFKYNAALGEVAGLKNLYLSHISNTGMHTFVHRSEGNHLPVQIMRIDDLHLQACDLIQLDVEGFESSVLLGAWETIEKYRPVISVENFNDAIKSFFDLYKLRYEFKQQVVSDSILVPLD